MGRDSFDPPGRGELEERIRILERENDFLVTRSEDMLLLGLVAESVHAQEDCAGALGTGLERMSVLRNIPLCVCGSLEGEELEISSAYISFADESELGKTIAVPEGVIRALGGAVGLLTGDECEKSGFSLPFDQTFVPDTVLLVPFSSRSIPSGLFLFADNSPGSRLAAMSEMLQRLVELIASRLDNLSLLEELQGANEELDRKVEARTEELRSANEGLRKEVEFRTEAEQALRLSEERYRLLIENARDSLFVFDRSGAFVDVNPQVCRQLGYTREELTSLSVGDIVVGMGAEEMKAVMARIDSDGHLLRETAHRRKDGSTFPVEVSLASYETAAGRRYQALARDITNRRRLEEQLRQAQKMESVGRLAGGIAHDFNNLLSSIIGFSELTLMNLPPDDPLGDNLREIIEAGQRAAGLTRQLLVFSRKQVLEMKTVDLNAVIEHSTRMLGRMIGEDVVIKINPAPALPPINADVGQLEQVLMNLVVNARDAMPKGGELLIETACVDLDEVYARSHQDLTPGKYVMFSVTDSGSGIDLDVQGRMFDPFFTTKEEGKGTGLGLATVYGIVRQHKGHVWFYSEPGRGATFKIHFPALVEGELEENALSRAEVPRGSETILVVDDDLSVRRLIARTIDSLGYRTLVAGSSQEALGFFEEVGKEIDIMLTDVIMPGMNGSRLAEIARSRNPEMKIMFMSGYPGDHIVGNELEEGTTYLQKPIALSVLAVKIREVLDGKN
jgi:two-component system cell cycle sensor histidine kinase/response regulator CckA